MAKLPKSPKAVEDEPAARHRSPNYPAVSLPNAVERVKSLIEKDGKAGAPVAAAAKHIGFSGAHGTARTVLSALKKFGLTSDQRGRVVPTQLAIDIVNFPLENPRSILARQTAALSPLVYKQLIDRYADSGNMPSAESLRPELVADMGFNPKAVDAFINDLFSSLEYAGLLEGNRLLLSDDHAESPADLAVEPVEDRPFRASAGFALQGMQPVAPHSAMRELTLPLMDNAVAYMRLPFQLSEENYDYLIQQMTVMRRGLVAKKESSTGLEGNATEDTNAAGIPFMITTDMRRRLLDAGFAPAQIARMSPQEAWIKISHHEGLAFDNIPEEN